METVLKKDQAGIPAGGTTGQRLQKLSNADYDYDWVTPTLGPVDPGDITYLDFVDTGITPGTFKYYLISTNLYAGFFRDIFQNTAADVMLSADAASLAQIEAVLGITINTAYTRATAGGPTALAWNGVTWTSTIATSVVDMILAN